MQTAAEEGTLLKNKKNLHCTNLLTYCTNYLESTPSYKYLIDHSPQQHGTVNTVCSEAKGPVVPFFYHGNQFESSFSLMLGYSDDNIIVDKRIVLNRSCTVCDRSCDAGSCVFQKKNCVFSVRDRVGFFVL